MEQRWSSAATQVPSHGRRTEGSWNARGDRKVAQQSAQPWPTRLFFQEGRHDPLACKRQIANTAAESMRHCVADRCRGRSRGNLADAEGHVVLRMDQLNLDFRHLAEFQHRVGLPIDRGNAVVEADLFFQHPTRGLNDPAFELVDHAVGINDEARISCTPYSVQTDFFVDGKLDNHGGIRGTIFVPSESDSTTTAAAGGRVGLPLRHCGNSLDHGTGTWIAGDRQAELNGILSGPLCEPIDPAFEREDVGHGPEPSYGRSAYRCFRHQMMDNAFGINVIKRLRITSGPATVRFRHIVRRWLRWWNRQGEGTEQISARAWTQIVGRTPDFLSPVGGFPGLVEYCTHLNDHRRRLWLVNEFFLTPPAHADRPSWLLHGDDCSVGRSVVGPVVAITARALHVMDNNSGGIEVQYLRQCGTQRIDALTMRPN